MSSSQKLVSVASKTLWIKKKWLKVGIELSHAHGKAYRAEAEVISV